VKLSNSLPEIHLQNSTKCCTDFTTRKLQIESHRYALDTNPSDSTAYPRVGFCKSGRKI